LFTVAPADLKARYAKMPEFVALATKWDPSGKFRNAFLDRNVFGA
jgi:xylitol oxidase